MITDTNTPGTRGEGGSGVFLDGAMEKVHKAEKNLRVVNGPRARKGHKRRFVSGHIIAGREVFERFRRRMGWGHTPPNVRGILS